MYFADNWVRSRWAKWSQISSRTCELKTSFGWFSMALRQGDGHLQRLRFVSPQPDLSAPLPAHAHSSSLHRNQGTWPRSATEMSLKAVAKKLNPFDLFFCQWLKWKEAKVFVHIHVFRFLRGYRVVDLWPTRAAAQTGCDIMSVPLWSQLNFCVCFVVSAEMRLSAVVQTREQGHQDQSLSLLHAPTVQGNTTPLRVSIAKYAAAVRKWFISATRFNTWDLWEIPAPTRLTLLTPNVQIRWVLHQHFIKLSSFISFISKMKS